MYTYLHSPDMVTALTAGHWSRDEFRQGLRPLLRRIELSRLYGILSAGWAGNDVLGRAERAQKLKRYA